MSFGARMRGRAGTVGLAAIDYAGSAEFLAFGLHFDGANNSTTFTDLVPQSWGAAGTAAKLTTANSKFGSAAARFIYPSVVRSAKSNILGGTGDMFIGGWVYPTDVSSIKPIVSVVSTPFAAYPGFSFEIADGALRLRTGSPSGFTLTGADSIPVNTWTHVAFARVGSTFMLFVNGVKQPSTATAALNIEGAPIVQFGYYYDGGPEYFFLGDMDDMIGFRGSSPVSSSFEVPTTAFPDLDPYWGNVAILLNMEGAEGGSVFTDYKGHPMSVWTPGSAKTLAAAAYSGSTGLRGGGSGSRVYTPADASLDIGTADFTLECRVRMTAARTSHLCGYNVAGTGFSPLQLYVTSGNYRYAVAQNGSAYLDIAIAAYTINSYDHIAVVRQAGTINVYINGTRIPAASRSFANSLAAGYEFCVAGDTTGFSSFPDDMDDVRLTIGVARYTTDFTPPTAPFPTS